MEQHNSPVKELCNNINELVDKTDSITELLIVYQELNIGKKDMDELNDKIKNKIRAYLKERKWERYNDEKTKMSVSISVIKKDEIDKKLLREMLDEEQLKQITKTTTFERLNIISEQQKKEMAKYGRTKQKI
jgi:hypothetical protein